MAFITPALPTTLSPQTTPSHSQLRTTTFVASRPTRAVLPSRARVAAPRMAGDAKERTFVAVKPDGLNRGLLGSIVSRFEAKGYKLVALKLLVPSRELAEAHYAALSAKPFFADLVSFITSGPVAAMVWEGNGAVATARKMIGQTSPLASEPGTIRGDYALDVGRNVIHGSDAVETADREIALWFQPSELCDWTPTNNAWIYE